MIDPKGEFMSNRSEQDYDEEREKKWRHWLEDFHWSNGRRPFDFEITIERAKFDKRNPPKGVM